MGELIKLDPKLAEATREAVSTPPPPVEEPQEELVAAPSVPPSAPNRAAVAFGTLALLGLGLVILDGTIGAPLAFDDLEDDRGLDDDDEDHEVMVAGGGRVTSGRSIEVLGDPNPRPRKKSRGQSKGRGAKSRASKSKRASKKKAR